MVNLYFILKNGYKKLVSNSVVKGSLFLKKELNGFRVDDRLKNTAKLLTNSKKLEVFLTQMNNLIEKSRGTATYNRLKRKIDLESLLEKNKDMIYELRAKKEETIFDYIMYSFHRRMQMLNNFRAFNTLKKKTYISDNAYFVAPSYRDYSNRQWYWDSCFHAIVLASKNPNLAKSEVTLLLKNQYKNGFIPHINYFDNKGQEVPNQYRSYINTYWSNKAHSDITQPPMLATAVARIYRITKDSKFLNEIMPKMISHYNWFHQFRTDENGLVSIIHPWESGWDNSQRWDEILGIKNGTREEINEKKMFLFREYQKLNWDNEKILNSNLFVVQPVDLNCVYAFNLRILSKLCKTVNDNENSETFQKRAMDVENGINKIMKHEDYFVDYLKCVEKKSSIKSAAMFFVLLTKMDFDRDSLIKNHFLNEKEFATRYPIPSVSIDAPLFNPNEYWRGNTWININWLIVRGLLNRGYKSEARKLINRTLSLVKKSGFREYYNPLNGKGLGAMNFGWSTLSLDLYKLYNKIIVQ